MFCVAFMICAHDVAVKCAIALLSFLGTGRCKNNCKDARGSTSLFFKYGLYMFCVACMISAHDVAVTFAIALLFMSRNTNMQKQRITTRVL